MLRLRSFLDGPGAWLAVAVLSACLVLLNPIGFLGGGGDDSHYLNAARCWISNGGPCLPNSHWWTRWPVIGGTALGSFLFGESRLSIGLGALSAWVLALVMTGWLGRLWFGRGTGMLSAALLAGVPVATSAALQPGADVLELAFQLSALVLATLAFERQSIPHALLAGVAAALAVQTRETSLLFCGVSGLAWLMLPHPQRTVLLWAVVGFGAVMAAEMLIYWWTTGDPLLRLRLSLGHVRIPSEELAAGVDLRQSPLFNPAYIAGWKREMGIALWWPVDPWLNLLIAPRTGFALLAAAGTVVAGGRFLDGKDRRMLARLWLAALLVSFLLVYGLAVDPKPRMFLLLLAASVMTTAVVTVRSLEKGQAAIPLTLVGLSLLCGAWFLSLMGGSRDAERAAARWVAQYPDLIEVDPKTRSWVTLARGVDGLPDAGTGRPLRMASSDQRCDALLTGGSEQRYQLVGRAGRQGQAELCLFAVKPD